MPARWIWTVYAAGVVAIVRRETESDTGCGLVHGRIGGGIAIAAGLDAGNQLEVALVGTPGRQRLHDVQVQRGADDCRGGVHRRQRSTGHDHRVQGRGAERIAQAEVLATDHRDVVGAEVAVARSIHHDGVVGRRRSEEYTSELQSLMRISYAVFCLKKTKHK